MDYTIPHWPCQGGHLTAKEPGQRQRRKNATVLLDELINDVDTVRLSSKIFFFRSLHTIVLLARPCLAGPAPEK